MRKLALVVLGVMVVTPVPLRGQVDGIIIVPFKTDSAVYGDVGQVVDFTQADYRISLDLPTGPVQVFASEGNIVPLDPDFTTAYILAAFRACQPMCRASDQRRGESELQVKQDRLRLVQRLLELFPDHPDVGEFRAIECDLLGPLDGKETGIPAIECAERFVRDYPNHSRADEMEWWAASMRNDVYEFEGSVELMKAQADAFEAFLAEHPDNAMRDQVRSHIARLYYMMQESSPPGPSREQYRSRADELYNLLANSAEESIRLNAIIYRFNLEHGRRIYGNPNAWTHGF